MLEAEDGLVTYGRADTKTGADWWVGPPGGSVDLDFEDKIRLEVSGTDAVRCLKFDSGCGEKFSRPLMENPTRQRLPQWLGSKRNESHSSMLHRLGSLQARITHVE